MAGTPPHRADAAELGRRAVSPAVSPVCHRPSMPSERIGGTEGSVVDKWLSVWVATRGRMAVLGDGARRAGRGKRLIEASRSLRRASEPRSVWGSWLGHGREVHLGDVGRRAPRCGFSVSGADRVSWGWSPRAIAAASAGQDVARTRRTLARASGDAFGGAREMSRDVDHEASRARRGLVFTSSQAADTTTGPRLQTPSRWLAALRPAIQHQW